MAALPAQLSEVVAFVGWWQGIEGDPKYVLGYGIDRDKIAERVNERINEPDPELAFRVSNNVITEILDKVDVDENWLAFGTLEGRSFIVISFGNEAFDDSCEELERKNIPAPAYLQGLKSFFYGPAVFNFDSW
ncbi:hypothetical protein FPV67DRAFT_1781237 [Lyophyllum atratum]|nr:hypothetical protein FPV67DRAFT_1781237 [Lyophyllum atratum]